MTSLLVVAGEASGDRAAAAVVERLKGVRAFGLGGAALAARADLVADLRRLTALGVAEPLLRAASVARAWVSLLRATKRQRPRGALLVNYTEFNARLAPRLRAAGVPVLWYVAPQIWAWRAGRGAALAASVDRMAVVLPFEEALWRKLGADVRYVGHPALEGHRLTRAAARGILGLTPYAEAIAVMPGSRPHEVRSLLVPMLEAFARVRGERGAVDACVLVAPSLDEATTAWVRGQCSAHHVRTFHVDPAEGAAAVLPAFDVSLCASGTASLEAALARAVPVVAYRVRWSTALAARVLLRTPDVALPNVLLGRRAFTELLQGDASAEKMASAIDVALERRESLLAACDEVEAVLGPGASPSADVAEMLAPWLDCAA